MSETPRAHIKKTIVVEQPPEPAPSAPEAVVPPAEPLVVVVRRPPADPHHVLEHLYDAIVLVDLTGVIRLCNHRAEGLFGYPAASLPGMRLAALVEGISAALLELMEQQLRKGRFTVLEARCTRQNGSQFPAEIAVGSIALEDGPGLCFSLRNITRRRELENELRMAQNALQHAACALLMADLDSKLTFVNPAFCALWGVTGPEAVLGCGLDELFGADAAGLLRACLETQAPWSAELNLARADGTTLRVQATAAPNTDSADVLAGLVISFIDLAPRASPTAGD